MSKIKKLDETVINMIAAGEVVEAPCSVIKELAENSIDAEAKKITIEWTNGGFDAIRITDNGTGLNKEDAMMAVERHATSKITVSDDLYRIKSYGFRGEAIASIASVSIFEMVTSDNEFGKAMKIDIEGGELKSVKETARSKGTTITVSSLFFNQPVRKKFMKTVATENTKNIETTIKLALANPQIHFTIASDGKTVYELPPVQSHKERFFQVYKDFDVGEMICFNDASEYFKIISIISKPSFTKKSRKYQHIFVNGRWVQYKTLGFILSESYMNLIATNRSAVAYIFLEVQPDLTEVNIHPAKREIKFYNEQALIKFLINSIQYQLSNSDFDYSSPNRHEDRVKNCFEVSSEAKNGALQKFVIDEKFESVQQSFLDELFSGATLGGKNGDNPKQISLAFQPSSPVPTNTTFGEQATDYPKFLQLFNSYIVTTLKSGVVIIDQHAAHERVIYDKMLAVIKGQEKFPSKMLLFPTSVELSVSQYELVISQIEMFDKIGFSFRAFSGSHVVIESCPEIVKPEEAKTVFTDILDGIVDPEFIHLEPLEKLLKSFSCKAAVKFGEKLPQRQMEELIMNLFSTKNPDTCPHGRPIIYKIGIEELKKKFLR